MVQSVRFGKGPRSILDGKGCRKKGPSEKVSGETKKILKDLGALLHETSDDLCPRVGAGTDQSIALAKAIAKPRPDLYYMPNQYENDANYMAHYDSTGPEIWAQTNGKVSHFFTGCGTGGTITGVATYLKQKNRDVRIIAIQAQQNHLLQGLRNFEESAMPELFKRRQEIVDHWITATNKDSFEMARELAMRENLLVGPSSGSVMASMLEVANELRDGIFVGLFADDGRKFKSLYVDQGIFTSAEYDRLLSSAKNLPRLAYQKNR